MFLKNSWYCGGWANDLKDTPTSLKVLGKLIVIYRGEDGTPIAMDGICPHRFAPLAKGKVEGDNISCPYHGLVYNKEGQCILNPHADNFIPDNAKVNTYPIVENDGVLWLWMGDAEPDKSRILDSSWITSGDYSVVTGYLHVEANYQMIMDNLLDLTHVAYVHPDTVGGDPELSVGAQMDYNFDITDGDTIHSNYTVRNMGPTPLLEPWWGKRTGDFRAEMRWKPASCLELDVRMSPPGADKTEGIHSPSFHLLVPETETSTHYFYAQARNVLIHDEEQTAFMAEMTRRAFEDEDEPMIRACHENMEYPDLFDNDPVSLQSDVAGIQARRMLKKRINAEHELIESSSD